MRYKVCILVTDVLVPEPRSGTCAAIGPSRVITLQGMLWFLLDLVAAMRVFFVGRTHLALEILALRQQVAVLKRKRTRPQNEPGRPAVLDRTAACLVGLG
jgi:hypothetical protein